jgi:di/tricarboxylate transporter
MSDGLLVMLVFGAGMAGFASNRIRHDLVALLMLAACVLLGLVPAREAFAGFSDPAVITVACIMLISAAVSRSGVLERLLRPLQPLLGRETTIAAIYALLCGTASSVMNNVGALALLLPAALGSCRAAQVSPSRVLMPMGFASLLGGLVTMVGTPPNILLADLRAELTGTGFALFDFARVGLPLALVGTVMTIMLVRLLPVQAQRDDQPLQFRVADYLFELRVPHGVADDLTVERLAAGDDGLQVHAIDRGGMLVTAPRATRRLLPGDVVQVEGRAMAVERVVARWGLEIASDAEDDLLEDALAEFVVVDPSPLAGNPQAGQLLAQQGAALVAISRRGKAIAEGIAAQQPQAGDVLLLQLADDQRPGVAERLGLLPLAPRPLRLGLGARDLLPVLVLLGAILAAATGAMALATALLLGVLLLALAGRLSADAYRAIDWPVIVMLAAMLPVAATFGKSDLAGRLADLLAALGQGQPAWLMVAMVLALTMAVTPFVNNAAAALIMAPMAVSAGAANGIGSDAMLMAVGVAASCDFLTPIGHQSNTLVWGPGGYQFGDYARIGAPISLMVLILGTPLILWAWG